MHRVLRHTSSNRDYLSNLIACYDYIKDMVVMNRRCAVCVVFTLIDGYHQSVLSHDGTQLITSLKSIECTDSWKLLVLFKTFYRLYHILFETTIVSLN